MTGLIFSYLIYNILAGIFLSINYYQTESRIIENREFFWLLLFPAIGLGKWRYNQKIRLTEDVEFPEKWFIWKYMIKENWGYIISIGVVGLVGLIIFGGLFGDGTDWPIIKTIRLQQVLVYLLMLEYFFCFFCL